MIKFLWLTKWEDYQSEAKTNDQSVLTLSKMNLFIGKNNSGKSRFLRYFADSDTNEMLCLHETDKIFNYTEQLKEYAELVPEGQIIGNIQGNSLKALLSKSNFLTSSDRSFIEKIPNALSQIKNSSYTHCSINRPQKLVSLLTKHFNEGKTGLFEELSSKEINLNYSIYIPILRGMRPLLPKPQTPYIDRTLKDYFGGHIENANINQIITGENLYSLLTEYLLGLPEQRRKIRLYEELLSTYFFEGESITLIPKHNDDVVNVKIGNEPQFPIFKLGDGLQQIIIITSAVYLTENFSNIFIEEPEICLHPGILRKLMMFMLNETDHQYFATTHSNHLLELADENDQTSIHKINKISGGDCPKFKVTTIEKDKSLLLDLGVKSSSVYLTNCTIWVEGITDRLYIKSFMKKYISSLEETNITQYRLVNKFFDNYHFSFVEYQGGNLAHWSFTDEDDTSQELQAISISTPIFLIADGDIKTKGNRAESLKKQLEDKFYLLECKEIENLIPHEVLIPCVKGLFNNFRRETYGVNIDSIDSLKESDYFNSDEGVGFHIDQTLGLEGKGSSDTNLIFAEPSGTVKDKMALCKLATEHMNKNQWELTKPIRDLCEAIYTHIIENNSV